MYKDTPVTGKIKPLGNGTRLRDDANTAANVITSYGPNDVIEVDLIREHTTSDSAKAITAGDKWGRVIRVNGVERNGWMAKYYQRASPPNICTPDYIVNDAPPPPSGEKPKILKATIVTEYSDGSTVQEKMIVDNEN